LAALVRFALATGCRASEITNLEWDRVDLERGLAWLNQTKNGTPRGVPLNRDAVAVLEEQLGQHPRYCFTYRGQAIRYGLTNHDWQTAIKAAGLDDIRLHDLRPYLGFLASPVRHEYGRIEGFGRMENQVDGGSLHEVCNRAFGCCSRPD